MVNSDNVFYLFNTNYWLCYHQVFRSTQQQTVRWTAYSCWAKGEPSRLTDSRSVWTPQVGRHLPSGIVERTQLGNRPRRRFSLLLLTSAVHFVRQLRLRLPYFQTYLTDTFLWYYDLHIPIIIFTISSSSMLYPHL